MNRILYVDDEPALLHLAKLFLEKDEMFAVDTLTSASEALVRLNTERYDAIISDYQMPGMDGIAFLKQLKASGDQTPFIIFTGRGREEVVIEALNNGADFYIQKGGDPKSQYAELAHKIQSAIGRQRTEKRAKDTERRLYDIINFLPDATFAIDTGGIVIAWNRAIEEMTGVPSREMLGKGNYEYSVPFYGERRPILIDLVSLPDEELSRGRYAVIKKEGGILIAETPLLRPMGRYSVLHGKAAFLHDDNGEVIGAIESIRDITEQKQVQEVLRESRHQLDAMATNVPGVVYRFCVNQDGTYGFDYISRRSRQILDLENDPARFFDRITQGIAPKERDRFLKSVQHAISTKTLWVFDGQYVKPSGETVWISAVSSPIMENDRLIFDGVIFDNTDRMRAEEELLRKNEELSASYEQITATEEELRANLDELTRQERAIRESEERYRQFFKTSLDSVFMTTPEGQWVDCNDALVEIFGYDNREEVFSVPVSSFYARPEERSAFLKLVEQDGYVKEYPLQFKKKDGTIVNGLISIESRKNPDGSLKGFIGTVHDINKRKQAQEALEESEKKYRAIFNTFPDLYYQTDLNGIIITLSPSVKRLSGWEPEELIGHTVIDLYPFPEQRAGLIETLLCTGEVQGYEITLRHKDGRHIKTSVNSHLVCDGNGKPTTVEGTIRDISEKKKMEITLLENETKFREIFNAANDAIFLHKTDERGLPGKFIDVNDGACRMVRYSKEELLEKGPPDLTTYNYNRPIEQIGEEIKTRGSAIFESELRRKDGVIIPVEVSVRVVVILGRRMVLSIIRDLTRRKLDDAAFRRLSADHKAIIDHAPAMIFYKDTKNNFVRVNPAGARAFGIPVDQLEGKSCYALFPDLAEKYYRDDLEVINSGIPKLGIIEPMIPASGEQIWVKTDKIPIRDEQGTITGILLFVVDITERRRVVEALRESEEKFRLMIENSHDIIYMLTADGIFTFVSPAWTTLLGHLVTDVDGHPFQQFVHPEDIPGCMTFLQSVIVKGQRQEGVEYRVRHADGTWYWHTSSGVPLKDETGKIVGFYGIAHDITQRKQMEDALRMANKKLNLLSGITRHDIRNQLMALNAYIHLSKEVVNNPAELEQFFAKEQKIADTMAEQIGFTRDYETLGVKSAVWQEVNARVRHAGAALPMGMIGLDVDCTGFEVFADPLLEKVFYNLIDNSLHYGGDKITAVRVTAGENGVDLKIIFEDDGNGISAEDKKDLFTKGFGKHTGLGLFLSREILSITGITITENGEPGKGVLFEIAVPKGKWRIAGNDGVRN